MKPIDSASSQSIVPPVQPYDYRNQSFIQVMDNVLTGLAPKLASIDLTNIQPNLSNFVFLQDQLGESFLTAFRQRFQTKLHSLTAERSSSVIAGELLRLWMDVYCVLIKEIELCSEAFTLEAVKQQQETGRKRSGSRKGWLEAQTEKLQQAIRERGQLSSQQLKQFSDEFGRSVYSVQSKVQKLLRLDNVIEERHKGDNFTLEKKIQTVLKRFREGLNREEVLAELEKMFQMGEQLTWKKSVSQLLCSLDSVAKVKGTYRLLHPVHGKATGESTYKYRTVRCMMELPNYCGTLRQVIDKYIELFVGDEDLSVARKKSIEAGITKVLKHSNEFDRRNSKTRYRYAQPTTLPQDESSSLQPEQSIDSAMSP